MPLGVHGLIVGWRNASANVGFADYRWVDANGAQITGSTM